jgi:hypothetical protein
MTNRGGREEKQDETHQQPDRQQAVDPAQPVRLQRNDRYPESADDERRILGSERVETREEEASAEEEGEERAEEEGGRAEESSGDLRT